MFSRMEWHQNLYLTCVLCFWTAGKAITVFEGEYVVFPLKTVNNFMEVEWSFSLHQNNTLLAILKIIGNNRTNLTLDNRFHVTENGFLVLKDARFNDAGNYICNIIDKNGIIQKHIINLHIQPHNISVDTLEKDTTSSEDTIDKNSTSTQSPDAKGQRSSLRTVIIACSVTAVVVFVVGTLSWIICRCRKTDDRIYANIPKGRNTDATTRHTAKTVQVTTGDLRVGSQLQGGSC